MSHGVNVSVLAGTVSADPVNRRMPSGDEDTELRLSVRLERQEAFSTLSAALLFEPVELPLHHFDGRTERFERGHDFVVEVGLGVLPCVRDVVASILQVHRLPLR